MSKPRIGEEGEFPGTLGALQLMLLRLSLVHTVYDKAIVGSTDGIGPSVAQDWILHQARLGRQGTAIEKDCLFARERERVRCLTCVEPLAAVFHDFTISLQSRSNWIHVPAEEESIPVSRRLLWLIVR
jgi:hypothetical protein